MSKVRRKTAGRRGRKMPMSSPGAVTSGQALSSNEGWNQASGAGSVGTGFLLNAEQLYQQAVINTLQARANRFADTVALFQSLGGGWWNRVDVAGESLQPLQPLQAPQPPPGERP